MAKRIKRIIEDHLDTKDVYNTKKSYKRIKIKNFSKNEKKLIKKFSEWRENYAQKDDLPRNWIVSDKNLIRASKNRLGELKKGKNTAVLSIGAMANNVHEAIKGLPFAHYDMRFVKPLDDALLNQIFEAYTTIITVENGTTVGGFGSAVLEFAAANGYTNKIKIKGVPDAFIEHGTTKELEQQIGLDVNGLREFFVKS